MGNTESDQYLLPFAFKCGHEWDGKTSYLGRAWWHNRWIPAKIIPERQMICISYNNKEIIVRRYIKTQILLAENLKWILYNGNGRTSIPFNAVEVDPNTKPDKLIHIGRMKINNSCCPGRIEFKELLLGYGGNELTFYNNYEVLVYGHQATMSWRNYKCQKI